MKFTSATPFRGWGLVILTCLAGPIAYLWPMGFVVLATFGGAILAFCNKPRGRDPLVWALIGFVLVAVMGAIFSPVFSSMSVLSDYDDAERQTWAKLIMQLGFYLGVVLAAAGLSQAWSTRVSETLAWVSLCLAAVVTADALSGAAFYSWLVGMVGDPIRPDLAMKNIAQATYFMVLIYWPAVMSLWRNDRRRLALALTLATCLCPVLLDANAALIAFLAGAAVFCLARFVAGGSGFSRVMLMTGSAAFIMTSPLLYSWVSGALDGVPVLASWEARLNIWAYASDLIGQKPVEGWGLDASRLFSPEIPLHPHSAALQVWLELGLLGALMFALVWALVFRAAGFMALNDKGLAAASMAVPTVYFVISNLSFGVWQEWWLSVAALCAAWVICFANSRTQSSILIVA